LLSQIGNHELAYKHGKMALKQLPAVHKILKDSHTRDSDGFYSPQYEVQRKELIVTLVTAYYNTGAE
jgi:hypothetical protein